MRKILSIICLVLAAALLPAAVLVSRGLPADTRPLVEKKYAGWNGVLRAWVCCGWRPGGSFIRWLNSCATDFEKAHDGVYIEFTQVSAAAMRAMDESGIRPPELLFFSPGILTDGSPLLALDSSLLRDELRGEAALPVAMGGYIWVYNCNLADGAPCEISALLPDDAARSFSAAQLALIPNANVTKDSQSLPEPGLDLGLPANANPVGEPLEDFIEGKIPALVVSQSELARLIRLRDTGRGPDWRCAAAGQLAYTDQLLYAGVVAQDGGERTALAREFALSLLEEENQQRLADIGAFSVTGARVHADFSPWAELDALLAGRALAVPGAFSRSEDWRCPKLLAALREGRISPAQATAELLARLDSERR